MKALLEYLSEHANCNYISDLPRVYKSNLQKAIIEQIPPNKFTLESWNETIKYITKDDNEFDSISDAKTYFLKTFK